MTVGEDPAIEATVAPTRGVVQHLLTAGPVLMIRFSLPERHITYVSPNVHEILGLSESEAFAPLFMRTLVRPDQLPGVLAAISDLEAGFSDRQAMEFQVSHRSGSLRWMSCVFVPEIDDDGAVVAALGYILDVDDRRRAEEARRDAQHAAEEANRSKSQFLSRMSHELRTPLNAVIGFGQILEMDELSEDQREAVGHILRGGRHLLELINEVLEISHVEAGELALSSESVLAAELVHEAVDVIQPLADQRGILLRVEGSERWECFVFADRQRVKQVLLNLLSNAVKYNRPGGTIVITCDQSVESRIRVSVADTGFGIRDDQLDLLFAPFERLGAERTAEEGTGIGLAMSRKLTEVMGGTLDVASSPGLGSTFTLDLPRVEGPLERFQRLNGEIQPAAVELPARRAVVLHIEDNPANITLVERILSQRTEAEVIPAMFGRLGLELAREHHPAIVLLDLHLPDVDGEVVLNSLRDDPATASIPVVIVSADANPHHMQRLINAGAVAYLTKPIDVRELLRLVDKAIEDG